MHKIIDIILVLWGTVALVLIPYLINRNNNLYTVLYTKAPCRLCREPDCVTCQVLGEVGEITDSERKLGA